MDTITLLRECKGIPEGTVCEVVCVDEVMVLAVQDTLNYLGGAPQIAPTLAKIALWIVRVARRIPWMNMRYYTVRVGGGESGGWREWGKWEEVRIPERKLGRRMIKEG
ncbi:hypothetical protein LCGC14_2718900 [marine sediment metagenome]|uniref:Uncharacterized protein n=1 Tax=marine sediment metagenome TaxID=412755 RepID=A0A0F8ZAN1_9ZZZZ